MSCRFVEWQSRVGLRAHAANGARRQSGRRAHRTLPTGFGLRIPTVEVDFRAVLKRGQATLIPAPARRRAGSCWAPQAFTEPRPSRGHGQATLHAGRSRAERNAEAPW